MKTKFTQFVLPVGMGLILLVITTIGLVSTGCANPSASEKSGACEGYWEYAHKTYCYNWSKEDCDRANSENLAGAPYTFHEGQTCESRGLTPGN